MKCSCRRRAFSALEILVLGCMAALSLACLWPVLAQNETPADGDQAAHACQRNLKQLALGVLQYVQDYDEKMPPFAIRTPHSDDQEPIGWAEAIMPYTGNNTVLLQCPTDSYPSSTTRVKDEKSINDAAQLSGFSDYWYNENLSRIRYYTVKAPAQIVLFGDGDGGALNSNGRYTLDELYPAWRTDKTSPSWRHAGKANYAFVDGHVKALPVDSVTTKIPDALQPDEATFQEGEARQ